jgi:hypothetical protein
LILEFVGENQLSALVEACPHSTVHGFEKFAKSDILLTVVRDVDIDPKGKLPEVPLYLLNVRRVLLFVLEELHQWMLLFHRSWP